MLQICRRTCLSHHVQLSLKDTQMKPNSRNALLHKSVFEINIFSCFYPSNSRRRQTATVLFFSCLKTCFHLKNWAMLPFEWRRVSVWVPGCVQICKEAICFFIRSILMRRFTRGKDTDIFHSARQFETILILPHRNTSPSAFELIWTKENKKNQYKKHKILRVCCYVRCTICTLKYSPTEKDREVQSYFGIVKDKGKMCELFLR